MAMVPVPTERCRKTPVAHARREWKMTAQEIIRFAAENPSVMEPGAVNTLLELSRRVIESNDGPESARVEINAKIMSAANTLCACQKYAGGASAAATFHPNVTEASTANPHLLGSARSSSTPE